MQAAEQSNVLDASRFDGLGMLWQDLQPSPDRFRQTARMTLAVLIAAVLCYVSQLPMMWLALYFCIALAKKSVAETVLTGTVVMVAIPLAILIGLLSLRVSADVPPLRVALLALYVFGAFFFGRIMKDGDLAHDMGIAMAFIMMLPDVLPTPGLWPVMAMKFVHVAFIGIASVVGVTCLIPPRQRPQEMDGVLPLREAPDNPIPLESVFEPDAFSNKTYVQHAIKGTLAVMTCYFLISAWNFASIHTCVVTCLIIALSTSGAMMHKMMLRIGGATIGALLALLATAFIIPHLSSITTFCLLLGAFTFIGAWVAAGDERIAYAGWQICLAVFMMMTHGFGPSTDLSVLRNRLLGILLGNVMMALFFTMLWPERAAQRMWSQLMKAFQQLAALARLPVDDRGRSVAADPLPRIQRRFNDTVANGLSLANHALYERGAFSENGTQSRRLYRQGMDAAILCAQTLQAINEHGNNHPILHMPQALVQAGSACQLAAANVLEQFANHLQNPTCSLADDMNGCSSTFACFARLAHAESSRPSDEPLGDRIALYARLQDQLQQLTHLSEQQKGTLWELA